MRLLIKHYVLGVKVCKNVFQHGILVGVATNRKRPLLSRVFQKSVGKFLRKPMLGNQNDIHSNKQIQLLIFTLILCPKRFFHSKGPKNQLCLYQKNLQPSVVFSLVCFNRCYFTQPEIPQKSAHWLLKLSIQGLLLNNYKTECYSF